MRTRNPVFDIMKGVGIILMLIGHIPPGDRLFHFIYSFHMPLFFIVAGVFAKTEKIGLEALKKNASRLLLPVLVTMLFIIILAPLHYITDHNFNYTIAQILSLLWAGDAIRSRFGVISLDSMWFLVALFWAKCIFQLIGHLVTQYRNKYQDELVLVVCIAISASAVYLHKIIPFVPFGFLKGMSAIVFIAFGWYLNRKHLPIYIYIVFVLSWFLALRLGAIDMYRYYYRFYPLDILGAIGATGIVYLLSKAIDKYAHRVGVLFQWFGVNSLLILCVNTIDRRTFLVRAIKNALGIHPIGLYNTLFSYFVEFLLVALIIAIPFLRKIYKAIGIKEICCCAN